MLKLIARMWRKRQRSLDMKILWPACKAIAPDLAHAKAAFASHAFTDLVWTKDLGEQEITELIKRLR